MSYLPQSNTRDIALCLRNRNLNSRVTSRYFVFESVRSVVCSKLLNDAPLTQVIVTWCKSCLQSADRNVYVLFYFGGPKVDPEKLLRRCQDILSLELDKPNTISPASH